MRFRILDNSTFVGHRWAMERSNSRLDITSFCTVFALQHLSFIDKNFPTTTYALRRFWAYDSTIDLRILAGKGYTEHTCTLDIEKALVEAQ